MRGQAKISVSEVFGPTIQGEGALIGKPTVFVRTGGCDYRCSWCLGPNTIVTMADERRKKITDVQVGDVLIGYDEQSGTLQPTTVIRTVSHESEDIWSFGVGNNTVCKRLVATGEHLWMTTRGWVATHDLQVGDVILTGHDYAISSWRLKQQEVAEKHYKIVSAYMQANNPMRQEGVREKVNQAVKAFWTPERRDRQRITQRAIKQHREKMLGALNPMKDPDVVARQIAKRSDWKPSSIELRVQRLVEEAGLPYILNLMKVRVGRRYPDFVIPGTYKVVEVYHPTFFKRELNGYAQQVLQDYTAEGWEVLPLAVRPSITDEAILKQLTEFALNGLRVQYVHPLPVKARGAMRGNYKAVYDITCSPYPTFFANGLLTHNCDTLYAVLPEYKSTWTPMTAETVFAEVQRLSDRKPILVTLSGGNPAIQPLEPLIDLGHEHGYTFAIETQGSVAQPWFAKLDYLTLSPKPPSSEQTTRWERLDRCIAYAQSGKDGQAPHITLKVVVFDEKDFAYARYVGERYPDIPLYLQAGNHTPPHLASEIDTAGILARLDWLIQRVNAEQWYSVTVLPQLHSLIWGNKRGV